MLGDELERGQVTAAIDSSLTRLLRDHIDVMLLHLNSVSIELATPVFEEMEKALVAGELRAFGWSTDYPESAAQLSTMEGFICIEHAMNVFVDVPSIQETVVPSDDVRSLNNTRRDYFENGRAAPKYLDNLAAIRELLQTGGRTLSQGALCWLLAKSNRNIPIPGARTVEQIQENAGALAHGPLPATVMLEIEKLIQREPEGPPRAR